MCYYVTWYTNIECRENMLQVYFVVSFDGMAAGVSLKIKGGS